MTSREREILEILKKEPMIAQQALADRLKLNRSSVAVHIANLMKKGYIMGKGYIVSEEKKVTVIGGSNIDLQGFPNESLKLYDSNPGKIETSLGGVGRNISENLAKLDIPVRLISVVGNDFYGQKLIKESEEMGIDMKSSLISDSYPTSMYLSIMDEQNDMQVAISQMEIYELIDETFIQENQLLLKNANIIVLDTNIPKKTIDYIGMNFSDIPIFVDPVSSKKAMRLKDSLSYIHTIKPNRHEVSDLLGIPADTIDDIRKAEFMKQYEKQDFEVIVSDIKENFIIVLYPERMVYGKLFYNNRYFHLGKDGYSIMGHNGEKIMIGDIFNARLTKVNILNGEVVFSKGISEINEINHTENNRKRKVRRK